MTPFLFFFGATNLIWALLVILCSLPLVGGMLHHKTWVGKQLSPAFPTPEAWLETTRRVGRTLMLFSLPSLLVGVWMLALRPTWASWMLALILLGPISLFFAAGQSMRVARRNMVPLGASQAPQEGAQEPQEDA